MIKINTKLKPASPSPSSEKQLIHKLLLTELYPQVYVEALTPSTLQCKYIGRQDF